MNMAIVAHVNRSLNCCKAKTGDALSSKKRRRRVSLKRRGPRVCLASLPKRRKRGQVRFYRDIVPLPRDDGRNRCGVFTLQRDRFNPLDFFAGERELFGLEVFFHMLLTRGSGQWEHADLHGKPKDDLRGTRT